MKKFFLYFVLIVSNIFAQTPDLTLPRIYKDTLPGYNQSKQNQPPMQDEQTKQEKKEEQVQEKTREKIDFNFKEILENKNLLNLIILIVLILIFLIYRFRR